MREAEIFDRALTLLVERLERDETSKEDADLCQTSIERTDRDWMTYWDLGGIFYGPESDRRARGAEQSSPLPPLM